MKCCECKNKATFVSPKNYCDFHWTVWWMTGYEKLMSRAQYVKEFDRTMRQITKKFSGVEQR